MAGASLSFTFDDTEVRAAFGRLRAVAVEPEALLHAMGVGLVRNVRDRFDAEHDPEGQAWAPLRPAYAATKKGPGILREKGNSGGLQGSIAAHVDGQSVAVGSNKIYAAVHQFGATIVPKVAPALVFRLGGRLVHAKSVTIPARPYLGFSADDEQMLVGVAEDYMAFALDGLAPPASDGL